MGAFDGIQFAKYRPTYTGLPVDQFVKTAQEFNTRYENAVEGKDKIDAMLANTPAADINQPILKDIANGINTDLRGFIQEGNWEDAPLAIKQTAQKHIITNPLYKGVVNDYTNRQDFLKMLDEGVKKGVAGGGFSKEYADKVKKYELDLLGNEQVHVGSDGALKGVFNPITPPKELDLTSEMVKIGKEVVESSYVDLLKKYPGIQGYLYQDTHTGKDPKAIQMAVQNYILNSPDAKSYLDFKVNLDHHDKFYNPDTKSYNTPTQDDIIKLGYNVYNPVMGPPREDEVDLRPGDIRYSLGPVATKDKNGNDTDNVVMAYSKPIGNINETDLNAVWRQGASANMIDLPIRTVVSMLGGQKVDRKLVEDNVYMENYKDGLRKRAAAEEDQKVTTFAVGYKLPAKGVVNLPKSYNDVAKIKHDFTVSNLDLRNDINSTTLTEDEKQLVSGFLINKNKYSTEEILGFHKWSDPAVVALLGMKRDATRSVYDSAVMIENAAKKYANVTDEEVESIVKSYRNQAIENINAAQQAEYSSSDLPIGSVFSPTNSLSEKAIERESKLLAFRDNSKLAKFNSFLEAQSNQSNILSPTNFFGSSSTQTKDVQALVSNAVEQGLSSGGMLTVYDPQTGTQITENKRDEILGNLAPSSIDFDVIPGHEGISIIGRPIIGKEKNGVDKLGDYVIIDGVIGLENILASNKSSERLINYKNITNKAKVTPGIPAYLPGTRNARVTMNLANPDRPNDPPSYKVETFNGKDWVADIPLFSLGDVYGSFDLIYNNNGN